MNIPEIKILESSSDLRDHKKKKSIDKKEMEAQLSQLMNIHRKKNTKTIEVQTDNQ